MSLDQTKLEQFFERFTNDLGAAMSATLVVVGDRLGLYKALAHAGPVTPVELAERTATAERYIREWLAAQAASGYVEYEPATGRFSLTPEQAFAFTSPDSPVDPAGSLRLTAAMVRAEDRMVEAFRTGTGVGWHEHHHTLFEGTERTFRSHYANFLVQQWIPALEGVGEQLRRGAVVADVGCGHGASTILMARAFPQSHFRGFDYHDTSIAQARQRAADAGVTDRVTFEVGTAKTFPGTDYDLVTFFDCLHDLGDPAGAARHVRTTLASGGTWMIVEPHANDRLEDNLNPVGRIFYSASTMFCTPASLSQEVGAALGAQAGETRVRELTEAAGFSHFRRAAETPFNRVYEVRA
jgi:SAM-dependent methyltransferase